MLFCGRSIRAWSRPWNMRCRTTEKDPLGLFPPYTGITDDAGLNGVRQMGPNIWALHGMRHAIAMAEAMGKADDARRFQAEERRFRAALEKQLALQTAKSGGWIPPAVEKTLLGNHWDNMMLLYPEPLFEPVRSPRDGHHPQVPRVVCRGHFGLRAPGGHRQERGASLSSTPSRDCTIGTRRTTPRTPWCAAAAKISRRRSATCTPCCCIPRRRTRRRSSAPCRGALAITLTATSCPMGRLRAESSN